MQIQSAHPYNWITDPNPAKQKISFFCLNNLLITVSYRKDIYNPFSNHNIVEKPAEALRLAPAS
jgi:hypothetical protein